MTIPAKAAAFTVQMDPAELLDFQINLKGDKLKLLADDELCVSYTLTLYPEAAAVGFSIKSTGGYTPNNDGSIITVWFEVDAGDWTNALFDGGGFTVAMELTVDTDHVPPRRRQRTLTLTVVQL
jgi:hypothetical protein